MQPVRMRALSRRADILAGIRAAHPRLFPQVTPVPCLPRLDRNAVVLGRNPLGHPVTLPVRPRLEHAHVIGTTGAGKSKFIEYCVRQDIANGHGVCVVDPHGEHPDSLYRSVLNWLDASGVGVRRTIHLIDPNAPTHIVGFNPLARPDDETDLSVVAGVTLEAFSRAWGGEDTATKPTIERVLTATFTALAELRLTLVEAPFLLDRNDRHGLRAHALQTVTDRYTRDELRRLHELSLDERRRHDFDLEVVGPINRIARFVRPPAIRSMVGQTESRLDFRQALDRGEVILCNLSGGAHVYERDADLLGRLLTRSLFFHAKRRRAPERPFFLYLDECHRYLSGDIESILAESRKYGVATLLSHQWLAQLETAGDNMLAAVLNATNLKVVFRIKDPEEAERLAHAVVPLDLETPVRSLVKPGVIGHRRVRFSNESASEQKASTISVTELEGESVGRSVSLSESVADSESVSVTESVSDVESESSMSARTNVAASGEGFAENLSYDPMQVPMGMPIGMNQTFGMSTSVAIGATESAGQSRSSSRARSSGSARSHTTSSAWAESMSRATHRARSLGEAQTHGTGTSRGTSESLEPILANLPTAVHGKENALYMAAQTLRNLATGTAFVNYVGAAGMVPVLLTVPRFSGRTLTAEAFAALRSRLLSASRSAISAEQAASLVERREQSLLLANAAPSPPEPTAFRTAAPPGVAVRGRTPPAAAVRGRSRRPAKGETAVR